MGTHVDEGKESFPLVNSRQPVSRYVTLHSLPWHGPPSQFFLKISGDIRSVMNGKIIYGLYQIYIM